MLTFYDDIDITGREMCVYVLGADKSGKQKKENRKLGHNLCPLVILWSMALINERRQ